MYADLINAINIPIGIHTHISRGHEILRKTSHVYFLVYNVNDNIKSLNRRCNWYSLPITDTP